MQFLPLGSKFVEVAKDELTIRVQWYIEINELSERIKLPKEDRLRLTKTDLFLSDEVSDVNYEAIEKKINLFNDNDLYCRTINDCPT